MSPDADIAEDRTQRMLAEAAELDLALARHIHALALASDEPKVVCELARTQARMTRAMRQSLALAEKLKREPARPVPRPTPEPEAKRLFPADILATNRRAAELRTAVRRLIWTEGFEKSDWTEDRELPDYFFRDLESWIADDRLDDDFTDRDLDDQVEAYAEALGLNPANVSVWRHLPDPPIDRIHDALDEDSPAGPSPPTWRPPPLPS